MTFTSVVPYNLRSLVCLASLLKPVSFLGTTFRSSITSHYSHSGLVELLEVASELEEIRYESSMDITSNTRPNCSVLLERIYFCMDYDRAKEKYREKVTDYVKYVQAETKNWLYGCSDNSKVVCLMFSL